MNVAVVGTGYVGLVTGACLAERGHLVVCVDRDAAKVAAINRGASPICEPGLEPLIERNVAAGRLGANTDLRAAITDADLSLIAVGAPFDGRQFDLSEIRTVAAAIGAALAVREGYHVVVVKSTVAPGTTDDVVRPLLEEASGRKAGLDFGVGVNPEFLTEGRAVSDFMEPDRIVLGGIDESTMAALEALYAGFEGAERLRTNNKTAELIKHTSNALLATMVSFSNEIANLCAAVGEVDVVDVMRGVHLSRYLSATLPDGSRLRPAITSFLAAGCGFEGSSLPKHVNALIAHGERAGLAMEVLRAVMRVNDRQALRLLSLLKRHFPSLAGIRVSVLGHMRESPAVPLIEGLLAEGTRVSAYDPAASVETRELFAGRHVRLCGSLEEAVTDVDAILVVTRWDEFREVPALLARLDRPPLVVDGRRLLDKRSVARYEGIGASRAGRGAR
jgi:UDPglucose 6-dehydrogenase/GDP-mannose 6-dehydrogenase